MHPVTYGSVCSGIEAATVAVHPLGWKAAWLAEIEPFPAAVLAHHYPDTPNLGDMTAIAGRIRAGEVAAPDVLVGGTPCQAFSIAGLRHSLADERGQLTLQFVRLANAIDDIRRGGGQPECVVWWENVPGVLSASDNAFGCFLGALAGCDAAIPAPPGRSWTDAGVVDGPVRTVAWRTLDAQFFGLAQRRRRVFVVASARDGFDPAAVLFEFDGVRRDSAPSREAREGVAGGAEAGAASCYGGGNTSGSLSVAACLTARGQRIDFEVETFAVQPAECFSTSGAGYWREGIGALRGRPQDSHENVCCVTGSVTHALNAEGADGSEDGTGRGTPIIAFDMTQITSKSNVSNPKPGDPCHPLAAGAHAPAIAFAATDYQSGAFESVEVAGPLTTSADRSRAAPIAFSCKDYGADAGPISPTLRSMGHDGSHANAGGQVAVAFDTYNQSVTGDVTQTLCSRGDSPGGNAHLVPAVAFQERGRSGGRSLEIGGDVAYALTAPGGGGRTQERNVLTPTMQVRRLTPEECETLQGFPRGYTRIPWRKKPAADCPDGPRYKALGNSMAVPCMKFIGSRIDAHLAELGSTRVAA